jgi:tRNA threonylcarbamoyladenosine biosynthesis protein TsaE
VVLLSGPLGAGKTSFTRGVLRALGFQGTVVSPTYNLVQLYETIPPVLHSDLYRVGSAEGIGLEDYLESHALFFEWPDRLQGWIDENVCWKIDLQFADTGRLVTINPPLSPAV